jgi:hypothetical protein
VCDCKDFKQFGDIKAKEFLNLAWTKSNKEDLSPHLLAYCRRFNQVCAFPNLAVVDPTYVAVVHSPPSPPQVSWWVATQIVEASDRKRQQHLIKKFIMTADVRSSFKPWSESACM